MDVELEGISPIDRQHVLILGGSNFMGKDLVVRLVSMPDDIRPVVYVINRAKSHWNKEIESFSHKYHFYYGDRDSHIEYTKLLKYLTVKAGRLTGVRESFKWDLVVDFCGYLRKEVKSAIRGLSGSIRLYVFISSDSVYDVSETSGLSTPVREEESVRPSCNKEIMEKAEAEDYGHDKFKCEEYLKNHASEVKVAFPYLCLRLPDVIGPYDSTGRFWAYLLWLRKMEDWPIHTKKESSTKPLSFVFSQDVVRLTISFLTKVHDPEFINKVHTQSYNIAFIENPTLDMLVQDLSDCICTGPVNFISRAGLDNLSDTRGKSKNKGKFFFPSVYCPHLDTTKAKIDLGFRPSTLKDAVLITCNFFENAAIYEEEFKKAVGKLAKVGEMYK